MPRKSNERKPVVNAPRRPTPSAPRNIEQAPRDAPQNVNPGSEDSSQERRAPANHIYVGKKPVMGYAMSALIQLAQAGEITIKARGLAISRAVDVAQVVTKRLGNGAFSIRDVRIDTEVVGEGPEMRNISSIEIVVGK